MTLKVFQVVKAFVKGYFCSNYSEIDFGIREMLGFNIERQYFKITFDNLFSLEHKVFL